jgi:peptidoglycan/LPS O-acetylase OafA/YrhL
MERGLGWFTRHFELARDGGRGNLPAMEGLRGLAVFLVFLTHYVTLSRPWVAADGITGTVAHGLHTVGNVGVDLFFVLSGYLIYGALLRRQQPFLPYLGRRIRRLYPAFIAVFVLYLVLTFLFPAESKVPPGMGPAATWLLANFLLLPGLFPITPLITVAWSLSYEFFFYLTVPVLIGVGGLRQWASWQRVLLFCGMSVGWLVLAPYGGNALRMVMFAAGMVLYEALAASSAAARAANIDSATVANSAKSVLTNTASNVGSWCGAFALAVGLGCTLLALPGHSGAIFRTAVMAVAFGVLCYVCLGAWAEGWLGRAFSVAPVRWLGNASYSYYLIHGLALKAAFMALAHVMPAASAPGDWLFWALLLPFFMATLVPAAALFLWVEKRWSLTT